MALVLANRVQETTTTTGTGTITLAGAVSGYQSFAAIGNANTTYYTITSGTAWEVGIGTYTSAGTTLARTTILSSSAAGAAITLSGTSNVFADYPAERAVAFDSGGNQNLTLNNIDFGYSTFVTSIGTTTLTVASPYYVYFTGTNSHTVVMPVTSTLALGWSYHIANNSTQPIAIQSSGLSAIGTLLPGTTFHITCIDTTVATAAGWNFGFTDFNTATGTGSVVLSVGPALTGSATATNFSASTTLATSAAASVSLIGTGTIAIGATTATNAITVGQSTGAQTVNLATGATLTATTKAVNIGTNGVSGSTTTITIGAATGTTTTINGTLNYTSAVGSTSQTVPLISGGTGAASNLTIQSTSGAGTTDYIAFRTASQVEAMRILTGGNVGIGTSSPGTKLDVSGVARAFQDVSTGNSPLIASNTNAGSNTTKYTSLLFQGTDTVGTVKSTGLVVAGPSDINYVTSYMAFQTRSADALSERMRIDSSGNMLLGTSTTKNRLTVTAGANTNAPTLGSAGGIAYFTNTDVAYGLNVGTSASDGHTWLQAQRTDGTATAYNLTLNEAGGNVGIGTSSPGSVLQLNKASGAADLRLSVGGTLYTNIYASSSDVNIFGVTAIPLILGTNNTERMRITSAGDVGIGASAPATKLEVNGGLIAGSENRQTHPPTGPVGFKAQWNFTGGDGETDFYNLYSVASTSFRFYQTTGSGTAQLLYNMRPTTHEFYTGGTLQFSITSTGGITSASLADAVGYKGLPQNSQTASYTLALTDMGKHISITTGGVVIPANGSVAFPIGAAVSIFNNSGSSQTISITTDTLRQAGTANTGSRTLAQYGVATCLKVTSTVWVISGAGVT